MKKPLLHYSSIIILLFILATPQSNWAQVTLPYSQNFEGNTSEWTLQSSSPNKWVVGTAAKSGGSKGLYISNDNGTSNAYTESPSSYSETYASFQANLTGVTYAELKFDWKSMGEDLYDYGDVWINTGNGDILISDMVGNNDPQSYG